MKNLFFCGTILSVFLSLNVACDDEIKVRSVPNLEPEEQIGLTPYRGLWVSDEEQKLIDTQEEFAVALFERVLSEEKENFVLPTHNLGLMLAMIANGMSDEAKVEIVNTLFDQSVNLDKLNSFNSFLLEELPKLDNSPIHYRHCMGLVNTPESFNENFKLISNEFYSADIKNTPFTARGFLSGLNNYVSKITDGNITSLTEKLPENRQVFADIDYFRGLWTAPFDKSATRLQEFTNHDKTVTTVEMMNVQEQSFVFHKSNECEMVRIPLGNESFIMYAFMSEEDATKKIFKEVICGDKRKSIIRELNYKFYEVAYRGGEINFPKFEISTILDDNLMSALKGVGIRKIFEGDNDLSLLLEDKSMGGIQLIERNIFKIDEEGAEGADLGFNWVNTCGPVKPIYNSITFNRPFYFLVEERRTGAIIYMGAVRKL